MDGIEKWVCKLEEEGGGGGKIKERIREGGKEGRKVKEKEEP